MPGNVPSNLHDLLGLSLEIGDLCVEDSAMRLARR